MAVLSCMNCPLREIKLPFNSDFLAPVAVSAAWREKLRLHDG
jgi:hypothetical protein